MVYSTWYMGVSKGALMKTPSSRTLITRTLIKRTHNLWKQPLACVCLCEVTRFLLATEDGPSAALLRPGARAVASKIPPSIPPASPSKAQIRLSEGLSGPHFGMGGGIDGDTVEIHDSRYWFVRVGATPSTSPVTCSILESPSSSANRS